MSNQSSLRARTLHWLRAEMNVHTHDAPALRQGARDDERRTTIVGSLTAPSRGPRLAYPGLYVMTASGVLAMAGSRHGMDAGLRTAMSGLALAALFVGTVLLVLAWRARPTRSELRIELLGGSEAPGRAEIAALRGDGSTHAVWLVADAPWSAEAIEEARAHGMRCFFPRDGGFVEDRGTGVG